MPKKKYVIDLTEGERAELLALTTKGMVRARKMKRAQILLRATDGFTDTQIMADLEVGHPCVERVRQRFGKGGLLPVDERYPEADVVHVILDNLNTHRIAALCEVFEPTEARRIVRRLELHYTPKHGSWRNMAELELSVSEDHIRRSAGLARHHAAHTD